MASQPASRRQNATAQGEGGRWGTTLPCSAFGAKPITSQKSCSQSAEKGEYLDDKCERDSFISVAVVSQLHMPADIAVLLTEVGYKRFGMT